MLPNKKERNEKKNRKADTLDGMFEKFPGSRSTAQKKTKRMRKDPKKGGGMKKTKGKISTCSSCTLGHLSRVHEVNTEPRSRFWMVGMVLQVP